MKLPKKLVEPFGQVVELATPCLNSDAGSTYKRQTIAMLAQGKHFDKRVATSDLDMRGVGLASMILPLWITSL